MIPGVLSSSGVFAKNDIGIINTGGKGARVGRRADTVSLANFFLLSSHSPCAILTAGILILMVAFAILDSRHETLSLEERASAPIVQDGKGLQLLLSGRRDQLSPSGLLDHIRGDEMRKEEATSARRWQNNRTKNPIPNSAVVTLPPSSLSPPPRVFALRERVHPIFPGISKHCLSLFLFFTPRPILSTTIRAPF